jgi:hypothetical protein
MARPTKLTPETSQAILDALAIGATYKDAAEAAGVAYDTFNNWMQMGESAKSGQFFEFFQSVRQAQADARLKYLSTIAKAAKDGDWRAALEYLKRRDRANWGDNLDLTSKGEEIKPPQVIEIIKTVEKDETEHE